MFKKFTLFSIVAFSFIMSLFCFLSCSNNLSTEEVLSKKEDNNEKIDIFNKALSDSHFHSDCLRYTFDKIKNNSSTRTIFSNPSGDISISIIKKICCRIY